MRNHITIYGDTRSGNCLKVKWVSDHLKLPYQWVDVAVDTGAAKDPAFLALNPQGQVPMVILADGRVLAQSNAIILHLSEGTSLVPTDPYDRARMWEAMFWEQYSHEPAIAVRRWRKHYLGQSEAELDPSLLERGQRALALMEEMLKRQAWMAGNAFSCADVALVAYTRMAGEGGFRLEDYPGVQDWISRCERYLGLSAYVSPPGKIARD
jgi:glutathione S-transferase